MKAVGRWSVFDLGIARVESLEDLVEQGLGLCLEFFQADLMLAAGCGSVHGVHKTKALQGALPSFAGAFTGNWSAYCSSVSSMASSCLATFAAGSSATGICTFTAACLSLFPIC